MKILFACEYFHLIIGGAEEWNKQVAFELSRRQYEVTALTYKVPNYIKNSKIDDVMIIRLGPCVISATRPYFRRALIQVIGVFLYIIRHRRDIDLIQAQAFPLIPSYLAVRVCRFLGRDIPLVALWHDVFGLENNFRYKGIMKGLIRSATESVLLNTSARATLVFVVSESTKRKLISCNIPNEKIRVVYGGVNLAEIDSIHQNKSDEPTIIYLGRLEPEKRVEDLIQSFSICLDQIPDARLIIVGSGRWETVLQNVVLELGIGDRVTFTGYISNSEKVRELKRAHILVLPSVLEGLGLVLIEALACGTPVIAVDRGGPREVIEEGVNGFLVKPFHPRLLAERMMTMMRDKNLRRKMADSGRSVVESRFTWDLVVTRIEDAYRDLFGNKISVSPSQTQ